MYFHAQVLLHIRSWFLFFNYYYFFFLYRLSQQQETNTKTYLQHEAKLIGLNKKNLNQTLVIMDLWENLEESILVSRICSAGPAQGYDQDNKRKLSGWVTRKNLLSVNICKSRWFLQLFCSKWPPCSQYACSTACQVMVAVWLSHDLQYPTADHPMGEHMPLPQPEVHKSRTESTKTHRVQR